MTKSTPPTDRGLPSKPRMAVRDLLGYCRTTLRRFPGLHRQLYRTTSRYVLPAIERLSGFRTPADDPLSFRCELVFGLWERETAAIIRKLVQPGHTALDLGAHVGYYTRLLSRCVGPGGRVIAFEPHPRQFELLLANVRGVNNVQPVRKAASSSVGTATLFDHLPETGGSSLGQRDQRASWCTTHVQGRELAPRLSGGFAPREYTVETVTIDQFLSDASIDQIDFVKVDIEGAEPLALSGMTATLRRSPRVAMVMEWSPEALGQFHCDPRTLLHDVRSLGFDIYTIDDSLRYLTGELEEQHLNWLSNEQPGAHINLLCLRGYGTRGDVIGLT